MNFEHADFLVICLARTGCSFLLRQWTKMSQSSGVARCADVRVPQRLVKTFVKQGITSAQPTVSVCSPADTFVRLTHCVRLVASTTYKECRCIIDSSVQTRS